MADARVPVAQTSACATTTAEWSSSILGERTCLSDVLRGGPYGVAVCHRDTIVTPASARWIANEGFVAGEPIVWSHPGSCDVDIANPSTCINGGITCAWIIVPTDHGKGHYTSTTVGHTDGRVGQVIVGQPQVTLQSNAATNTGGRDGRLDNEPLDTCLIDTIKCESSVESTPKFPICKDNLLHAGVVTIEMGLDFRGP